MPKHHPNVLFVFADQWRQQSTGFGGNPQVLTPNLDRFAKGAIHLPQTVASSPVCTPWRGTFLTGMNPDRHGLFLNDAPLDPSLPTIGKAFQSAGYDTAYIGKWHVDGHGRMGHIPPERRHGFDYWKVLECTHRYNESYYYDNDATEMSVWPGYDASAQTDDAIAWLRDRDASRPFFMVLSWGPPHSPYQTAPQRYHDLYDASSLTLPPNVPDDIAEPTRESLAGYYAHCSALDDCFGRLVDACDALGMADETIIVFTSDHGDLIGAHGLFDKQAPWDESVRVPLLIRWPRGLGDEGRTSDLVFQTTDFYPTLCGLAGVPIPDEANLQGRDCGPWLRDGSLPDQNVGFLGSYHTFGNWPRIAKRRHDPLIQAREYRGVRSVSHTYVESRDGPWLLYDNRADPYQLENLVNQPQAGAFQESLAGQLHRLMEQYGDEFLAGMEYVRRWGYDVDESGTLGWPDGALWREKGI